MQGMHSASAANAFSLAWLISSAAQPVRLGAKLLGCCSAPVPAAHGNCELAAAHKLTCRDAGRGAARSYATPHPYAAPQQLEPARLHYDNSKTD
jgi:hypothetical protein